MTDHDVLDRLLMAADPARTPRDAAPDAAALRLRDRIMRDTAAPRRARHLTLTVASGIAVATAAVVVAVSVLMPQSEAEAVGPQPLDFSDAASLAATIDDAQAALADAALSGPTVPVRTVRTASWGLNIDMGTGETEVVPQFAVIQWNPDQSGLTTIVNGVPYDPDDAAANLSAEVSSTGEVAYEIPIEPGQFATPVPEVFGDSRAEVLRVLTALGMPAEPSGTDVVTAMTALLGQWTLTDAQESQVLDILGSADGVTALGTTEDRLGRPVAGLRVVAPDKSVSEIVLLSLDTGRVVGVERTNLVEQDVLPAGVIMSYTMWDVDESLVR